MYFFTEILYSNRNYAAADRLGLLGKRLVESKTLAAQRPTATNAKRPALKCNVPCR